MLCITYRQYNTGRQHHENLTSMWQVGEDVPYLPTHQVNEIQADGDEAKYIEELMGACINRETQFYYGDLARTIYLNL